MSGDAVQLLVLLLVAHYLGDFTPLATRTMQEAKAGFRSPGPIVAHAAVHGALVLLAVTLSVRGPWTLPLVAAGVEFGTHLAIDLTRTRIGLRWAALQDPARGPFWYALGLDQLAHGLVLVWIAALVL